MVINMYKVFTNNCWQWVWLHTETNIMLISAYTCTFKGSIPSDLNYLTLDGLSRISNVGSKWCCTCISKHKITLYADTDVLTLQYMCYRFWLDDGEMIMTSIIKVMASNCNAMHMLLLFAQNLIVFVCVFTFTFRCR